MKPAYAAEPPIASPFSTSTTLAPSEAALAAALSPAIPAPSTRRSITSPLESCLAPPTVTCSQIEVSSNYRTSSKDARIATSCATLIRSQFMQLRATDQERALQDEVRSFLAQAPQVGAALPRALDDRMDRAARVAGRLLRGRLRRPRLARRVRRRRTPARRADRRRPGARRRGRPGVRQRRRARRARARRCCASATTSSAGATSRSILSAEEIWCQGFCEPEAGSDLASLRTRATENDDHFVLSGPKTWVSWGQYARWCGVLARTETDGRQAQGHLDADRRHAVAGRRRAPDDADHRPRRVLRALPRRRDRPQGEPAQPAAATAGRSPCTRSATSAGRPRSRARSSCARGSTAPSQDARRAGAVLDDPLVRSSSRRR